MRRRLLLAAVLLALPTLAVGLQLVQVQDPLGCPAHLLPSSGALKLHLFAESPAQLHALDVRALSAYLGDRFARPVEVTAVQHADATAFRMAAALQPVSGEMLAFLAARPSFPNVPTEHGLVNALGFATPGSACAYVSFLPGQATLCRLSDAFEPIQPAYAYLAHELGHLLGLGHAAAGIMGKGVFELCKGDRFGQAEQAAIEAWGNR
ncbi:MAG: hypothetical protein LC624_01735 [Halobacteriales archaeon]|nr:hypothetical protein [Halobacteriales archaeon]